MTVFILIIEKRIEVFRSMELAEAFLQSEFPELSEICNGLSLEGLIEYINKYESEVRIYKRTLIEEF